MGYNWVSKTTYLKQKGNDAKISIQNISIQNNIKLDIWIICKIIIRRCLEAIDGNSVVQILQPLSQIEGNISL